MFEPPKQGRNPFPLQQIFDMKKVWKKTLKKKEELRNDIDQTYKSIEGMWIH